MTIMQNNIGKKRICFTVYKSDAYGGVETVARSLVNSFSNEYEIFYLGLLGEDRSSVYGIKKEVRTDSLLQSSYESKRLRSLQWDVLRPMYSWIKKNHIDIVVVMGHYPAFLIAPLACILRAKIVFCDHGALMNQWNDKKTTLMRFIASKACDKIVVLTKKSNDDYIEKFHINPKKITYIYNCIEPTANDSKQYDASSHKLLSVGRLSREKGFDQLIEAMALVAKKHPDWTLDIYGDGEEADNLRHRINELKLAKQVILKGKTDKIRDYYKNYAAYVMPSYREGLPLTLLEAKINMLPIISFDVDTGPREIVRDGVDGFLVEPKNIEAFAEKICELIESKELRESFSEKAKENLNVFEKETILPRWRDLFEEI